MSLSFEQQRDFLKECAGCNSCTLFAIDDSNDKSCNVLISYCLHHRYRLTDLLFSRYSSNCFPPAPRLVGIELNPGPPKKTGGKNKKKSGKNKNAQKTRNADQQKKNALLKSNPFSKQHPMLRHHRKAMVSPFTHGPLLLGADVAQDIEQFSTYGTSIGTMNSDGSSFVTLVPQLILKSTTDTSDVAVNFLSVNTAAYAVACTAALGALTPYNYATLANKYGKYRIVSAALRVYPRVASTAVPGLLYGGCTTTSANGVFSPSTSFWLGVPGAEFKLYSALDDGYQVNWVPSSKTERDFRSLSQVQESQDDLGSFLFFALSGFPASTQYVCEWIVHAEGVPSIAVTNADSHSTPLTLDGPYSKLAPVTLNDVTDGDEGGFWDDLHGRVHEGLKGMSTLTEIASMVAAL